MNLNLVLQRVPEVTLHLNSRGDVCVPSASGPLTCGPLALRVLDLFGQPRPVNEVLQQLKPALAGSQEWIDLLRTINQLHEAGILCAAQAGGPPARLSTSAFDLAAIHIALLNDRTRTDALLAAIREAVRPGDVVIDLGTGTGVLAAAAAQAGARHVYAFEAGRIAPAAQRLFESNGLADRITLVQSWSTQATLPEKADLLIGEIIGNDPFGENVLEAFADARRRFLKPDARLIPDRVRLYAVPLTLPPALLGKYRFNPEQAAVWNRNYGINFDSLADPDYAAPNLFFADPAQVREWQPVADPLLLTEVDLAAAGHASLESTKAAKANRDGQIDAVASYFEIRLHASLHLVTDPWNCASDNHWKNPIWLLPHSVSLRQHQDFRLHWQMSPPTLELRLSIRQATA